MKRAILFSKRICALALCLAMSMAYVSHADTTQEKLDDTNSKINALQQQKKNKTDKLLNLNEYKDTLAKELQDLDAQLGRISAGLADLEERMNGLNALIQEKEASLAQLELRSKEQYESMKKRIKYTYENGQENPIAILLSSKSIADFLNRSEYAAAITNYDREMLDEYVNTIHEIGDEKTKLQEERAQAEAVKQETEAKQGEVSALIEEKRQKISSTKSEISEAEDEIAGYDEEIDRQRAYEEELEEQKAREDAARLEEIRRQETEQNLQSVSITPAGGDEALLAALIECEAGAESYEGKLAVGSVVLNRVASKSFPNTVVGVIYQGGQFSPVASGRFAAVLARGASGSCVKAAKEVLGGRRTIDALYFRRNNGLIDGTVLGGHVFY